MFNWPILDVAIGLVFVYTLLSLICSSIKEGISRFGSMRRKTMLQGLSMLLADSSTSGHLKDFLAHPLIKPFGSAIDGNTVTSPAYIPARVFAQVVLDLVAPPGQDAAALTTSFLASSIAGLTGNEGLKTSLLSLLRSAEGDVSKFRKHIETWFDDAMDRVSGIYKRKTNTILLVLSLVVVGLTNADTLAITAALWQNPALARALDAVAADFVRKNAAVETLGMGNVAIDSTRNGAPAIQSADRTKAPTDGVSKDAKQEAGKDSKEAAKTDATVMPIAENAGVAQLIDAQRQLQKVDVAGLPIGWYANRPMPNGWDGWGMKVLGLLLTTAAVCLGAPFWFDVLNKLVNLRGTGAVPAKSSAITPDATPVQTP